MKQNKNNTINTINEFISLRETYSRAICNDYKKLSKSFVGVGLLLMGLSLFVCYVKELKLYQCLLVVLPILLGVIISLYFGKQYDSESTYKVLKVDALAELVRVLCLGGMLIGLVSASNKDYFISYYILAYLLAVFCIPLHILFIRWMIKKGTLKQKHYSDVSKWVIPVMGIATTIGLYGNRENVTIIFAYITPLLVIALEHTMVKKFLRLYYAKRYCIDQIMQADNAEDYLPKH